jgi:DNA-binding NtrC family response regulator
VPESDPLHLLQWCRCTQHLDHGYDWPRNVRELANIIEQLCVRTEGDAVTAEDVTDILPKAAVPRPVSPGARGPLSEAIDALERSLILAALEEARGNKLQAARALGLSRTNLYAKLRKHGIAPV